MFSPTFATLSEQCGFLIFPSCAEGMAGSVLNGMARGLIPIVTSECGVDIENSGVLIKSCQPEHLATLSAEVAEWPPEKCLYYAAEARRLAMDRYNLQNFRRKFEAIIREVLSVDLKDRKRLQTRNDAG